MRYIGVDLHKRLVVVCVIEVQDGKQVVVERGRWPNQDTAGMEGFLRAQVPPWSEPSSNQNSLLEREPQVVAERPAAGFEFGFSRCKRERLTTKLAHADEKRRPAGGSSA